MSYPAAKAEPRVGVLALSESFLISRGGWDEVVGFGTAGVPLTSALVAEGAMVVAVVLGRFASGELGKEGGTRSEILSVGGGVAALVITSPRPVSSVVIVGVHWLTKKRAEW
jgi:hypothetical protein